MDINKLEKNWKISLSSTALGLMILGGMTANNIKVNADTLSKESHLESVKENTASSNTVVLTSKSKSTDSSNSVNSSVPSSSSTNKQSSSVTSNSTASNVRSVSSSSQTENVTSSSVSEVSSKASNSALNSDKLNQTSNANSVSEKIEARDSNSNSSSSESSTTTNTSNSVTNNSQTSSSDIVQDNVVHTKDLYGLETESINQTLAEGRLMGTHHDRQDLGIVLMKGATIKIRQTDSSFKGTLSVRLLGDNGSNESVTRIVNSTTDWTSVTADKADLAVFVDTPTDDLGKAQVQYEVASGIAKVLPEYKVGTKQTDFINQWQTDQTPYALIQGYNIQMLAPYRDLDKVKNTDLATLLHDYDGEIFPLYDYLTGITPNKSYNDHIQGRYFVKADSNGGGSAYYGSIYTANHGNTIEPYLTMNWVPWHEIGHGYEPHTTDIVLTDVFNNVYGTTFQYEYTDDFKNRDSWIWQNNKWYCGDQTVQSLNAGQTYSSMESYKSKLLILLDLLSYDKENVMIGFNELNRQFAVDKNRLAGQFGTEVAIVYAKNYKLDVIPYLDLVGIPVDKVVRQDIEQQHYQIVNSLFTMEPQKYSKIMKKLGWNIDDDTTWPNQLSLVTDSQLLSTGLTNENDVKLNIDNIDAIKDRKLTIYDGDRVVKQLTIDSNNVDLGNLNDGTYTAVISGDDGWTFEDPYIVVSGSETVNCKVVNNYVIDDIKNLYQDSSFTKVKDSETHESIDSLKGEVDDISDPKQREYNEQLLNKADSLIDEININGYGSKVATITYCNDDLTLHINYHGGQPHKLFKGSTYVSIKVTDPSGKETYSKDLIGDQNYTAEQKDVSLQPGSIITIYDAEGKGSRYSVSDPALKPANTVQYKYQITKDGHLRLLGTNTAPTIKVKNSNITINQGAKFNPLDYVTASDVEDGNLTSEIKVKSSNVNVNKPGTYQVTYEVTDQDGVETDASITVHVNAYPTINAGNIVVQEGDKNFDPLKGVTADDLEDGNGVDKVTVKLSNVDVDKPGTYQVTYEVTDKDGATTDKTVSVLVNAAPTIEAGNIVVQEGDKNFDPLKGVTADDLEDGNGVDKVTVKSSNVDVDKPGTYQITYEVTDKDGATTDKMVDVTVEQPSTKPSTDNKPSTEAPSTKPTVDNKPSTEAPSTKPTVDNKPSTEAPSTKPSTDDKPSTEPSTKPSTDNKPSTEAPSTKPTVDNKPSTEAPSTKPTVDNKPSTEAPSTKPTVDNKPSTEQPSTKSTAEKLRKNSSKSIGKSNSNQNDSEKLPSTGEETAHTIGGGLLAMLFSSIIGFMGLGSKKKNKK